MPKSGRADQIRRVTRRFDVPYSAMHGDVWQQTLRLDTAGYELTSLPDARTGVVPQVVGMGLKDALYLLEREGLRVTFTGVGYIQKQSLPAGAAAKRGALIMLQLGPERPEVEPAEPKSETEGEGEATSEADSTQQAAPDSSKTKKGSAPKS